MTKDSVRFAHSGPSQRILRGLRPLVSVGPLPLPRSGGGHAFVITTISLNRRVTKIVTLYLYIFILLDVIRCGGGRGLRMLPGL